MAVSRQLLLFTIYGILLIGRPASTGVPSVPEVSEVNISQQFRCQLPFNSDPETLIFGRVINKDERWIHTFNSRTEEKRDFKAACSVQDDFNYRCDWGTASYVTLPLNAAEWVYISYKKFNYVLTGKLQLGLLTKAKEVSCSFLVEK